MSKKAPEFVALDGLGLGNGQAIEAMMSVIAYFVTNGENVPRSKAQVVFNPRRMKDDLFTGRGLRGMARQRPINNPTTNYRRKAN
jgi:hypothetical protein